MYQPWHGLRRELVEYEVVYNGTLERERIRAQQLTAATDAPLTKGERLHAIVLAQLLRHRGQGMLKRELALSTGLSVHQVEGALRLLIARRLVQRLPVGSGDGHARHRLAFEYRAILRDESHS